jgi:hypothetical protein
MSTDNNKSNQPLYWALSRPLKYMGLSLDEWGVLLLGGIPGLICINSAKGKWGLILIGTGIGLCYGFKKFKTLSANFLLKSFLVAKGLAAAPKSYPKLLKKRVGK